MQRRWLGGVCICNTGFCFRDVFFFVLTRPPAPPPPPPRACAAPSQEGSSDAARLQQNASIHREQQPASHKKNHHAPTNTGDYEGIKSLGARPSHAQPVLTPYPYSPLSTLTSTNVQYILGDPVSPSAPSPVLFIAGAAAGPPSDGAGGLAVVFSAGLYRRVPRPVLHGDAAHGAGAGGRISSQPPQQPVSAFFFCGMISRVFCVCWCVCLCVRCVLALAGSGSTAGSIVLVETCDAGPVVEGGTLGQRLRWGGGGVYGEGLVSST